MAHTIKKLQEMSDEQLIAEHDNLAPLANQGIVYYLDELERRSQDKQTKTILLYTKQMLWFTIFIAILTIVNVIAMVVPLFRQCTP